MERAFTLTIFFFDENESHNQRVPVSPLLARQLQAPFVDVPHTLFNAARCPRKFSRGTDVVIVPPFAFTNQHRALEQASATSLCSLVLPIRGRLVLLL